MLELIAPSLGASSLAKESKSAQDRGKIAIIGGLFLQLIFFGAFMLLLFIVHRRLLHRSADGFQSIEFQALAPGTTNREQSSKPGWKKHVLALWIVSVLVLVRSIFRVLEYIWKDGPLLKSEVYLFVFDTALMVVLMVILNVVHPAALITRDRK